MKRQIKTAALVLALILPNMAKAEFIYQGHTITKLEALKLLVQSPDAKIIKACETTVTDKLAIVCKKEKRDK